MPKRSRWSKIAGLAWRESRTARRRLLLYMSSISLGVAALVAIDSFASNVQQSIRAQARDLMGGDVSFTSNAKLSDAAAATARFAEHARHAGREGRHVHLDGERHAVGRHATRRRSKR